MIETVRGEASHSNRRKTHIGVSTMTVREAERVSHTEGTASHQPDAAVDIDVLLLPFFILTQQPRHYFSPSEEVTSPPSQPEPASHVSLPSQRHEPRSSFLPFDKIDGGGGGDLFSAFLLLLPELQCRRRRDRQPAYTLLTHACYSHSHATQLPHATIYGTLSPRGVAGRMAGRRVTVTSSPRERVLTSCPQPPLTHMSLFLPSPSSRAILSSLATGREG